VSAPSLVFVVDDDASVRKGLSRLIAASGHTVEAFASVREFLARPPYEGPGCLVLDVRMPGTSGLDLQRALAAAGQLLSIVFITGHGTVQASVQAMKAGAVDFLTKPVDEGELLAAIGRGVAQTRAAREDQARRAEIRARIAALTPREAEILARVITGMLNKQIAAALGIAEKTVKVHRARVMEKMRAGSVAELVRLADDGGMIPVSA